MLTEIRRKEDYQLYRTPIVQQTAFWSEVKKKLGDIPLAIHFKSRKSSLYQGVRRDDPVVSDLLLVIRQLDKDHSMAYVPYGPELEPEEAYQGLFLEELSESLREFLPGNCILIRYDLCWESYWAKEKDCYDSTGDWNGVPDISSQELRFNVRTNRWNFRKTCSNILPSDTVFLDLTDNTGEILERMKPKTRYNIGLSARKGVTVRSMGPEGMKVWYELYRETALRNHFYLHDISYFEAVLTARADESQSPADVRLLVAELDHQPLAAMFLILTGNRGSYLYGASSSSQRNSMATYALQWEAIRISKAKGCTEYDMFGVSPRPDPMHPLYGLYKFKVGFGGELYHRLGCWDYPLDPEKYEFFRACEMNSRGFHTR